MELPKDRMDTRRPRSTVATCRVVTLRRLWAATEGKA